MKKFLYWLIGKPWIQYAGNDKYVVRLREGILTVAIDLDLYTWFSEETVRKYCYVSKETAINIRKEYQKTKHIL